MSVYVDSMHAPLGRMRMSHMIADTTEELLAMATRIAVNHIWIQDPGTPHEHFDISKGRRDLAVRFGAIEIDTKQLGEILKRKGTHLEADTLLEGRES